MVAFEEAIYTVLDVPRDVRSYQGQDQGSYSISCGLWVASLKPVIASINHLCAVQLTLLSRHLYPVFLP